MNEFYILGCGPSINDITKEQWDKLKYKNTIGFSFFSLLNKETKYFYLGENERDDLISLNYINKNTHIYSPNMNILKKAKELNFNYIKPTIKGKAIFAFNGNPWLSSDEYPPFPILDSMAKTFRESLMRFRGQLSTAINISLILGAEKIYLLGIDLNNQNHFYDIYPIYKDIVNRQLIDEEIKGKDLIEWNKTRGHSTTCEYIHEIGKISTILSFLKVLRKEMEEINKDIVVCSKTSKLYKDNILRYEEI